ncbi:Ger(x)C family spore germination protein [Paenibacillus sp.]|uniref:Ger(x)C family spore germination protein n=1 Tax=Paenibacillus sp. TaxID=58172 RepID=UPI002D5405DD|nr:Ger(x)C family spore germination protein [Paenibacillus sp.]HZG55714.1 Ger(x)C family spore germination protein [Paenibacillus sp.]
MQPWKIVCAALLTIATLSGCGGKQEISELAIVTAVGIDPGDDGKGVRITAQIIRAEDARGQTGAPSGGTGEPIYTVTAQGESIFVAIRNLARVASRRVYWAHNFVIAINEEFARVQGIYDLVDFFTRNHELRMETWVTVTPDRAGELVSTRTGLEIVPGESIDKLFWYSQIVGEAPKTSMMRVEEMLYSRTTHPMLARLALRKVGISNKAPEQWTKLQQVELSGAAVFHRDKMKGWLSPNEAKAALYFIQGLESSIVALPCPSDERQKATLELTHQTFKATPRLKDGEITLQAELKGEADLVESGCRELLVEMESELERRLERHLRESIEGVVGLAQEEYETDFLKIGDRVRNEYPVYWNRIERQWDAIFPKVEFDVKTKVDIKGGVLKVRGGDES